MTENQLELHKQKLNKLCRLCGNQLGKRKYPKFKFYEELGDLYGIELNFDSDNIHPLYICGKDANALYRLRENKSKGKPYTTDITPYRFDKHSDNCSICLISVVSDDSNSKKTGRPTKRKVCDAVTFHKEWKDNQNESCSNLTEVEATFCHKDTNISCVNCITLQLCKLLNTLDNDHTLAVFDKFLSLLDANSVDILGKALGKSQFKLIRNDASSFGLLHKDIDAISRFDTLEWLSQRNSVVLNFMLGLGNINKDVTKLETEEKVILASTVECAYRLNTHNLIAPFAFLQNVTLYSLTGSRTVAEVIGHGKPAGSYSTIVNWLRDQSTEEQAVSHCDVFNVFDNEQVIGYKSAIRPKNRTRISIITNKGFVELNEDSFLQRQEALKPSQILKMKEYRSTRDSTSDPADLDFTAAVNMMVTEESELYKKYEKLHYDQLYLYVNAAIEEILNEQEIDDENHTVEDKIDENIASEGSKNQIKCATCGISNPKRKQICIGCGAKDGIIKSKQQLKEGQPVMEKKKETTYHKLEFRVKDDGGITISESELTKEQRYEHVETYHKEKKEVVLTDPVYCNPNSFGTVALVLRQIGIENGISRYSNSSRHWTYICCDGVPYLICKKLKEEAVVCTIDNCGNTFLSKKEFFSHASKNHPESRDATYIHEFDWFYLKIGGGHFEMNLLKSFFELNWTPFLEKMCEEMGFVSDAAKLYAKSCKDHHKSWNLFLIFHFSTLRELVLPFVRHSINENYERHNINAKEFFKFAHNAYQNSKNYKYIMDQVCRVSQGIVNFRIGTRRNNAELVHSAKFMTKELFHGRCHPKYQQIELYDELQYLLMPKPVKEQYDEFMSITTSGNKSSGEDFDFVLEEKNRQLKQWISKGIPTDEFWRTICRNNALLEDIKQNTLQEIGMGKSSRVLKDLDIEEAVLAYRTILRKSKLLTNELGEDVHLSVSGTELDYNLVNYIENARKKRIYMLKNEILQEDIEDVSSMSQPIPVTPSEREKLERVDSMTKPQIEKEIFRLMQLIPDPVLSDYYSTYFNQVVKGKKKVDYISFLMELKHMISFAASAGMDDDDDVDVHTES